jgi:integrase
MAYLYRKKGSPHWYIQYTDAKGRKSDRSTGYRRDDPVETAKAREFRADLEATEIRTRREKHADGKSKEVQNRGWNWVPAWLERHCESDLTKKRYTTAWQWLGLWLELEKISTPRQLTYKQALGYIDWRRKAKKRSGKSAKKNTAIFELKLLSMVMDEAVRRQDAYSNPLQSLDVKKEKSEPKPEITENEIKTILAALETEPAWMKISFTIALATGCRLRETQLHVSNIKLSENKITFGKPKGGTKRAFSVPLPEKLRPMLTDLKKINQKANREWIFDFPFQPSRRWQQFFQKMKMPHLTFHCTRVTFITRMHRAGIPEEIVRRLVNHANELVHRIYVRERIEDMIPWSGKIGDAINVAFEK